MLKWMLLITLGLSAVPSYALPPLKPFQATYQTSYNLGFTINIEAVRTLSRQQNGILVLDFQAKNWFARVRQTSYFKLHSADGMRPERYRFYKKVFGKSEEQQVIFHWDQYKVTNDIDNKPWKMNIQPNTQDLLSYQLKLRYDLKQNPNQKEFLYQIADGGKIKTYTFRVAGEEILKTPMGNLNAVRIESLRHSRTEVGHLIWLARDWDNLVLRIESIRSDDENPVILTKATLDGITVKGF